MVRIKVSVDAKKAIDRMSDMEKRSRDFRVVLRFAKAEPTMSLTRPLV
jgi:hypothetical protein